VDWEERQIAFKFKALRVSLNPLVETYAASYQPNSRQNKKTALQAAPFKFSR
jgi:hypothetical protein